MWQNMEPIFEDSEKIVNFLRAFGKYFDLISLNQLHALILERKKPFSHIVLRRIFEYKRDLLKSKCTYNNGEMTFAVALILAKKVGQGDSAIKTLIGYEFWWLW
jgi:hypothetical protein